ncbi:MAG TPA: PH domain-containing protein [Gaiellaceae bacterium]|nr:PH domain-containing protein [Gaiellaceae bacterium]
MERVDSAAHRRCDDDPEEDEGDRELQLPESQRGGDERDDDERRERSALRSLLHDQGFFAGRRKPKRMVTSGWERVCLDERRHAIVLALPFARALGVAAIGIALMAIGWPASIPGVALQALAAGIALRAVWNWEQTRVVLTTDKLFVVHGTLRKRAAAVRLARIGAVEIEQGLVGRLLGYGTIVAGDLEIEYVPRPRQVYGLVERLTA